MKRAYKLLLLLIVIAGVIGLVVATSGSRDEPLDIVFICITNVYQFDRPVALFVATNLNTRPFEYVAIIERKTNDGWPVYNGRMPHNDYASSTISAGKDLRIVKLPPAGDAPWRISVLYYFPDTALGKVRWRVADFFYSHNLNNVGRLIHEGGKWYIAVGPEMRNDHVR